MSVSVSGTTVTFPDSSTITSGWTGFKNRIINGAMVINQRGFSGTPNNEYTLDRWLISNSQTGKFTISQSSDAPNGFNYSLLATSSSAYSLGSGDFFGVGQRIEGYNIADFGFGTANAKTITISFWVKSSLTGTFSGAINNGTWDTSYAFTYSISAPNTWEQKTITIVGTSSGTWNTTNGNGMRVWFTLGVGSTYSTTANTWVTSSGSYGNSSATNLVSTNGATLYITGIQLEKGSTASSFEYRAYGQELVLCQRYYEIVSNNNVAYGNCWVGQCYSSGQAYVSVPFRVTKRANPTVTVSTASNWIMTTATNGVVNLNAYTVDSAVVNSTCLSFSGSAGTVVAGNATRILANAGSDASVYASAEL